MIEIEIGGLGFRDLLGKELVKDWGRNLVLFGESREGGG
jgi:hypothetical protein